MAGWEAIETDFIASLRDFASGPEAQKALADFAAEKRDEVIDKDKPSSVTTFVDGAQGAPLEGVKAPDGVIRFEFGYLREVASEILNTLISLSPYSEKRPGANPSTHFKDEHKIFVNGAEVEDITSVPDDAAIVFVNLQPYSRKIERGLSLQAPSGVYEQVARLMRSKFGSSVINIAFGYDVFPESGPSTKNSVRGNVKKRERDDRFPTITLKASA